MLSHLEEFQDSSLNSLRKHVNPFNSTPNMQNSVLFNPLNYILSKVEFLNLGVTGTFVWVTVLCILGCSVTPLTSGNTY